MIIDEKENYYILPEEENSNNSEDNSPLNFAEYSRSESEDDDETEEEKAGGKKYSPFSLLFRIMFDPVEGWKRLRRSRISCEKIQSGCFYPLLALLAISQAADLFYSVNVDLSELVTNAVVAFVSYFFGFFCVRMLLNLVLPKDMAEKFDTEYGKNYILMAMSSLALFSIFTELLPMLWPILIFFPIWTLYVMFKGCRFFKFRQNEEMKFYIWASASTIGLPLVIDRILNTIMPY